MPLDSIRQSAVDVAITLKHQAQTQRWDSMRPQLIAYRGDEPVAVVMFAGLKDNTILRGFSAAAWGFDADTLALIFEGWTTTLETNPATSEPWHDDDFELYDAVTKGWAHQALIVICANRAGDIRMAEIPYLLNDHQLRWGPVTYGEVDTHSRWAHTMVRAMGGPSASVTFPGVTDAFSRTQRDVWTADYLQAKVGCRVLLVSTSEPNLEDLMRNDTMRPKR